MSKADDLYLMGLELQKQAKARQQAAGHRIEAIRDEERRQADEREKRSEQAAAATPEGRARAAWDAASDPRRWGYYEDEE